MAYLDNNGVLYLWNKVKSYVSTVVGNLLIPSRLRLCISPSAAQTPLPAKITSIKEV